MRTFLTWLRGRTPVLREMYPIALPFIAIAITVWTILPSHAAVIVSVMALTVVAIIVWASWGKDDDNDDTSSAGQTTRTVRPYPRPAWLSRVVTAVVSPMPASRTSQLLTALVLVVVLLMVWSFAGAPLPIRSQLRSVPIPQDPGTALMRQGAELQKGRPGRRLRVGLPSGDYSVEGLRATGNADGFLEVQCASLTALRGRYFKARGYTRYRGRVIEQRLEWEISEIRQPGDAFGEEDLGWDIGPSGRANVLWVMCPLPS